jgi:D-serine deaminase-like pyridoxal phosphate-dependent protein
MISPVRTHDEWRALLADRPLPGVIVDLDVVDSNLALLLGRMAPGPTLRIASKSVRVPAVLRHLIDASPRVQGVMTWSAPEAKALADHGFTDLLNGYPVGRPTDAVLFAELAGREGVRAVAMVDAEEQVSLLSVAASERGVTVPLCLDLDVSLRLLGGAVHLGVRRSPLRDVAAAIDLAHRIRNTPGVELVGVMAYEAQVAGLPDRVPGQALLDPIRRGIKARSRPLAAQRRTAVVDALRADGFTIDLVNGGGTGSIEATSADGSCTEVTAGSGFYCPTLFDGYDGLPLQPAAFFALPVVRRSDPDHITCAFGGFTASGPADPSRAPTVHSPPGLTPLGMEGFGEVQTPFKEGPKAPPLRLGDPVVCRHSKAGELMEHVSEVLLVRGGDVVDVAPTERGLGLPFG